jgi:hypothetical protein
MAPLRVEAVPETNPNQRSRPATVAVKLTNQHAEPVLVNKRLAMGYRNSLDRELFAEVFPRGGNDVISKEARDYQRDPPAATDYVWLQPGESVSTSFNLFRWYTLPGPGEYDLVVNYRGDDAPDAQTEGLLTGVHSSERVPFDVI